MPNAQVKIFPEYVRSDQDALDIVNAMHEDMDHNMLRAEQGLSPLDYFLSKSAEVIGRLKQAYRQSGEDELQHRRAQY